MTHLRIVLAEDAVLMREGLIALLFRGGHTVVRWVDHANDLNAAFEETKPDLVITDVRMPPGDGDDGLVAALDLRRSWPGQPILVLSQYIAEAYAADLLADGAGAVGYLLKERVGDIAEFLAAITSVAAGGTVIDPEVVRTMMHRPGHDPLDRITPRERDVLQLMAQGLSNQEIAAKLWVSEAAVVKHIGSIMVKLDLPVSAGGNRRVLAVLAWLRHRA